MPIMIKQFLNGTNFACPHNNGVVHSSSYVQILPGCYYPLHPSHYPNHYQMMMGSLHHTHPHLPLHLYKQWSHAHRGYPNAGYNAASGYSPQFHPLYGNPYGIHPQPTPKSSAMPPFNNAKIILAMRVQSRWPL